MAKADKVLVQRRIDSVLRIRLEGAEFLWGDVRDYVRAEETVEGSPWHLGEGGTPLSDGQLRRYVRRADALIMRSHERSRKRLFRRHLAQRRSLYARAVTSGDIGTALRCLRDEAELLNLYTVRAGRPAAAPEVDEQAARAAAVAFYTSVVANTALPIGERMRAQEQLVRLLGLDVSDLEDRVDEMEAKRAEGEQR